MGYSPWGYRELDVTEQLSTHTNELYFKHVGRQASVNIGAFRNFFFV